MPLRTPWNDLFLFARDPRGGIEDLAEMRREGFKAIFVNIRDFPENRWTTIRTRAEAAGMACGPWGRTAKGPNDRTWAPEVLELILDTGDRWEQPSVPNCESEIDHSDDTITTFIRQAIGSRNTAVSTLARPMQAVDWHPLHDIPILAQLFVESQQTDPMNVRQEWWDAGIECLLGTYGAYGGRKPSDYPLDGPYSVYTADDVGAARFFLWVPRSFTYKACKEVPVPPTNEWWEKPYTKGPPVGPAKLPRLVYPPDAAKKGKVPSSPGPDILAFKRAGVRAQRWDRKFTELDDSYYNSFAHGASMNVKDSGTAGFQRQEGIEDTGWIGDETYQKMRRALVPIGPNKGKPLFDPTAVRLLNLAADVFITSPGIREFYGWLDWLLARATLIGYSQTRPIQPLVDREEPPRVPTDLDCSGSPIYVSWMSDLPSPDPNGYSGFGNTDSLRQRGSRIDVAEARGLAQGHVVLAFYERPDHVVVVLQNGQVWSHGREEGPEIRDEGIFYRSGFAECRVYPVK